MRRLPGERDTPEKQDIPVNSRRAAGASIIAPSCPGTGTSTVSNRAVREKNRPGGASRLAAITSRIANLSPFPTWAPAFAGEVSSRRERRPSALSSDKVASAVPRHSVQPSQRRGGDVFRQPHTVPRKVENHAGIGEVAGHHLENDGLTTPRADPGCGFDVG